MFPKVKFKNLFILYTFNFFNQMNCEDNIPITLSCMPGDEALKYENFEVNFYYSSRKHKHQHLTYENIISKSKIDIDPTRRTVVTAHGFMPSTHVNFMYNLSDAFLEWNNVNVIYVDWEKGCSDQMNYKQAVRNMEHAAIEIANLFKHLMKIWIGTSKSKEFWAPLHFIGLSLGAHVVGQAAELLKDGNQPFVFRVTGLDPAEPCLDNVDSPLRLKKTNAQYVDVIHTDGERGTDERFGFLTPMGHVDFYVNGGSVQPGCSLWRKRRDLNYFRLGYHYLLERGSCHHLRSIELFTQSLKQNVLARCKFWAFPWNLNHGYTDTPFPRINQCDETKCIEMGIRAELYDNYGVYYVATTGIPPFCRA